MTSASAQLTRALDLLKARGMLRLKDFVAEGIGPETLARLVREETLVRPARIIDLRPPGRALDRLSTWQTAIR
jgi:hypothetical protein